MEKLLCSQKNSNTLFIVMFIAIFLLILSYYPTFVPVHGAYSKASPSSNGPEVNDDRLFVKEITDDLDFPTSMAFIGENDILVTEKNTGEVVRILDGQILEQPVLDVAVATQIERGLLGIDVSKDSFGKIYVFLYYTESGDENDGSDAQSGVDPLGNRLYRYEMIDDKLTNPLLLLDLPADPIKEGRTDHNGGKVAIGPDDNVYVIVGEVGGHETQAQNFHDGSPPNGLGGILRVTQSGDVVSENMVFGETLPLSLYYAMGIRNSFGIDFDPLTGSLWDTENGASKGDEINLVAPGFNSGWATIQGFAEDNLIGDNSIQDELVYFGNSHYSDPEFLWVNPIGITDLKFLNTDKLGLEYENNLIVGDINNGQLYRLLLNDSRNGLVIDTKFDSNIESLFDNTVDDPIESQPLVFGHGFGGITDLEVGHDGHLYVLSYSGSLNKILPIE